MHSGIIAVAFILALALAIVCALLACTRTRGHHAHHGGFVFDVSQTTHQAAIHVHLHV